ncbi:zinc transporter ZIP3-like [Saccostrea echinata]|uniref:zinc transporter ZIP3-like n=1 Tax=Saccostrea echinata TaxID=191078 RepID=UPI002A813476|nr:zinc transporter ZIP3-like [Saccostrea echinata]XP_061174177.1 zinc transporter ZIP3-like [Saccostrea echinata]XP_061174178.1 zinc transporter ZIP3-like [Saccostrea echinata]XP_061174179.1 zinc transporter ZIP3-like [Saccostrea echinata]
MASAARIVGIFVLFFITFLIGLLPFAIVRLCEKKMSKERMKRWIGILNCFTGGIFFGTAILHLLPEARELIKEAISYEYPITEAVTGCGFLITLTLEHLISYHGFSHVGHLHDTGHENKIEHNDDAWTKKDTKTDEKSQEKANGTVESVKVEVEQPNFKFLAFRSFLLLLALSFHMIFEGLAVGLQTEEEDAWILLGVLSLHKVAVAFSVGFQLEENLKKFKYVLLSLFLLSIVAPIGVAIGYIVTEAGEDAHGQDIASGVLQSISVGCFLYVTFFEILNNEIHITKERSHLKVLFTVLGYIVVIGIQFVKHDHEGHDH